MRAVVQRVSSSHVEVNQKTVGRIEHGLMVLIGVEQGDSENDAAYLAEKTIGLRIFEDDDGKMNRSLIDTGGAMLVVSQFTLLGDVRKGKRPGFSRAASPDVGNELYLHFVELARSKGIHVETGIFRADMQVHLVNDGPVTILIDSNKTY